MIGQPGLVGEKVKTALTPDNDDTTGSSFWMFDIFILASLRARTARQVTQVLPDFQE